MATLYVRDVPDPLYAESREIASSQGRSLSAYVVAALQHALAEEKLRESRSTTLARIARRRRALPKNNLDSVAMIRRIRSDRE